MSRTLLTPQAVTHQGVVLATTNSDQSNNNNFSPNSNALLYCNNTATVSGTLTIHSNLNVDSSLAVPNRSITVAAGNTIVAGPFSNTVYAQTDGSVWVDASVSVLYSVLTHGN